jgi:hypothetical protein
LKESSRNAFSPSSFIVVMKDDLETLTISAGKTSARATMTPPPKITELTMFQNGHG